MEGVARGKRNTEVGCTSRLGIPYSRRMQQTHMQLAMSAQKREQKRCQCVELWSAIDARTYIFGRMVSRLCLFGMACSTTSITRSFASLSASLDSPLDGFAAKLLLSAGPLRFFCALRRPVHPVVQQATSYSGSEALGGGLREPVDDGDPDN